VQKSDTLGKRGDYINPEQYNQSSASAVSVGGYYLSNEMKQLAQILILNIFLH